MSKLLDPVNIGATIERSDKAKIKLLALYYRTNPSELIRLSIRTFLSRQKTILEKLQSNDS